MIDLTLNEKDRDSFITKLYLKDGMEQFIVKYASGRLEEQDFSIHNFNVMLYKMEEQFLEYKDVYGRSLVKLQGRAHARKLIEAIMAIVGVYLTVNMAIPSFIQTMIVILLAGFTFMYQASYSKVSNICQNHLYTLFLADKFMEIKEKFKIQIHDKKTNQEEDWYLVSLSNVDELFGLAHLELLAAGLNEEDVKNQAKDQAEKMLNYRMSM